MIIQQRVWIAEFRQASSPMVKQPIRLIPTGCPQTCAIKVTANLHWVLVGGYLLLSFSSLSSSVLLLFSFVSNMFIMIWSIMSLVSSCDSLSLCVIKTQLVTHCLSCAGTTGWASTAGTCSGTAGSPGTTSNYWSTTRAETQEGVFFSLLCIGQ